MINQQLEFNRDAISYPFFLASSGYHCTPPQAQTRSTRTLKEMQVNAGDSIRFDIGFSGGSKDNLSFFHDGRRLQEDEEGVSIQVENDVASLIIEKAGPANSGMYECVMKTEGGTASCQVKCLVTTSSELSS